MKAYIQDEIVYQASTQNGTYRIHRTVKCEVTEGSEFALVFPNGEGVLASCLNDALADLQLLAGRMVQP